jgi:PAS domain S-box-containing protein
MTVFRKIWPRRLRAQLIWGVALVHLLLMSVFVGDMVMRQDNFLRRQSRQQALSLADELAASSNAHVLGNDFDGLGRVVQNFRNFPDLQYAMIVSPDNEVLSHTDLAFVGKKVLDSISLRMGKDSGSHILAADNQIIDAAAPVMQGKTIIAWARVGISQENILSNLAAILRSGIIYILVAIIVGTVVAILIGNRLTRGLYQLIRAAEKIRAGNRNLRATESGSLETDRLATAFNQMLDEISSNESLLRNAFDFSAIGMAIAGLDGQWTRVNNSLCNMLGYSRDELLDVSLTKVTHPDDIEKDLLNIGLLRQGRLDKYTIDKRYIHKSGRLVWVHLTVSAVKGQYGIPLYFVVQAEDVTDIIESTRELKGRESVLESIFQNTDGAISLVDRNLKYVIFNRQFTEDHLLLTGKEPAAGDPVYGAFKSATAKQRQALLRDVLRGEKKIFEADYLINGKHIYYRTSFYPVRVDGEVTGITTYSINLTAIKEGELEILKLNRVYQFISQINEMIVHAIDEGTILNEACRIAIEYGKFRFAWAGSHDAPTGLITPLVWAGHEEGYLDNRRFSSRKTPEGSGPVGKAVRSRRSVYCNDIAHDPMKEAWRDDALARGYRSSITFPLFAGSEVVSVLALYMDEPFFFTDKEVKLLKEVTDNISFALDKIRLRKSEERAQAELKESEQKFRSLVEQSQVGVYILQDQRFVYVNPLIAQMSGYSVEELTAMDSFESIIYQEDLDLAREKNRKRLDGELLTDDYVLRVVKKDGSIAYIQTIISMILYQHAPASLGSVIDITYKLQEDKRINKAVIDAQERERIQIGMELHDNVQQIIAGSMLTLDFVFASYHKKNEAINALRDIKRYLGESVAELRRISHKLAPSMRFENSLEEKVRALVETMNIGRSADFRLEIDRFGQPLSQEVQLAFYRIVQEQLTNILKYANASAISIRLKDLGRKITLSIKDNGRGFDPATKKSGIGLENIRRRVAALEGDMKIVSSVGHGCELLLQVPVGMPVVSG